MRICSSPLLSPLNVILPLFLHFAGTAQVNLYGPELTSMPPPLTHYSNSIGVTLTCVGKGPPPLTVTWLSSTSEELPQIPGIREKLQNGSLYFGAFKPEEYIPSVHNGQYRCSVRNPVGTFLSPVFNVRAILDHPFEVVMRTSGIDSEESEWIEGSAAMLSCDVTPSFYTQFVRVIGWKSIDQFGHEKEISGDDTRYQMSSDGSLIIFAAKYQQLFVCIAQNVLNKKVQTSAPFLLKSKAGTSVGAGLPPRPVFISGGGEADDAKIITIDPRKTTDLLCLAVGSPSPNFRWEKYQNGKLVPVNSLLGSSGGVGGSSRSTSSMDVVALGPLLRLNGQYNSDRYKNQDTSAFTFGGGGGSSYHSGSKNSHHSNGTSFSGPTSTYRCEVSNAFGIFSKNYTVITRESPKLSIDPPRVLAKNGQNVEFTCRAITGPNGQTGDHRDHDESRFDFIWFKDGKPLARSPKVKISSEKLLIFNVQLGDQGVYQCFTESSSSQKNGESSSETLYASSMLLFQSSAPELVHTFISQSLQPGPSVSLKCSAVGNPIPIISWFIDGVMVSEGVQGSQHALSSSSSQDYFTQTRFWTLHHTRFSVGSASPIHLHSQNNPPSYSSSSGEAVSYLNISEVHVEDSGVYQCTASNLVGLVAHSARLNVYGSIFVKEMRSLTLVAGHTVHIPCLFGGYPVDKIIWQKDSRIIDSGKRAGDRRDSTQRFQIFANGTLQIGKISTESDKGKYTCVVSNRKGEVASGSVDVNVMRPPVISTFKFDENLREGQRTSVSCNVISGDLPIDISWLKDGLKIPPFLNVTENRVRFLSVLLFDELRNEHSGEYSCMAKNEAAVVKLAAKLQVRVSPKWIDEPQDTKVILKSDQVLPCSASGVPSPTISWFRDTTGTKSAIRTNHKFQVLADGRLKIVQVEESDASQYVCEATNGVGSGISRSIRLDVIIPAKVSAWMDSVLVAEGVAASLQCQIRGDRPVQVIWKKGSFVMESKEEGKLHLQNQIHISHPKDRLVLQKVVEVNSTVLSATLRIEPSELADSGEYFCVASNQYGRDEDRITLEVKARPSPPESFIVEEIGSRFIRLRWSTSGIAAKSPKFVPVTYFILQWKKSGIVSWDSLVPGQVSNITVQSPATHAVIEGLIPVTNYDIRLFASNDIGHSFPTDPLAVLTLPEAPSGSPQNVSAIPVSPKTVIVRWEPPDSSMQHGQILGYQVIAVLQSLTMMSNGGGVKNKTTVLDQKWEQQSEIKGLRPNSQYRISVRAYNSAGMGPESPYVFLQTPEGAPDSPPLNLQCEPLSPKSLQVQWEPPPFHLSNGQVLGYKVIYLPVESERLGEKPEVKKTSNKETTLHGLRSYTSYTVKTLAYTVGGESEMSEPVICTTEEDVPDEPSDIKVMTSSPTSALISWLPPISPNGLITKYTIFWRSEESEQIKEKQYVPLLQGPVASSLSSSSSGSSAASSIHEEQPSLEVRRLKENQEYTFWVTAHTNSGSGRGSRKETIKITSTVPARIASFPVTKNTAQEQAIRLPCKTVGNPVPKLLWLKNHLPLSSLGLLRNGSLFISRVKDTDEGVYTCRSENDHGFDEIEHRIIISRPPSIVPTFIGYVTDTSIQIHWDPPEKADPPLTGYTLQYKLVEKAGASSSQDWKIVRLGPRLTSYSLEDLPCGSTYNLKLHGENSVGKGESSSVITARTNGKPPESTPRLTEILDGNGTMIRIDLSRWPDGGCPIQNFHIEYKRLIQKDNGINGVGGGGSSSSSPSSSVSQWMRIYRRDNATRVFIFHTEPNSTYKIRIKVENDAGSVTKTFTVESHPDFFTNYAKVLERVEVEERMNGGSSYVPFYTDPHVLVPIVSAVICTFAVAVCVLMLIRRKNQCGKPEWKFNPGTSQQSWLTSSSAPGNHHHSGGKCGENGISKCGPEQENMSVYATLNSTKPIPMTIRDSTVRLQSFGQHDNYDAPTNLISGNYLKRNRRKSSSSPPLEEMCMQQVSCQMEFPNKIEPPREFRSSSTSQMPTHLYHSSTQNQYPNSDSDDNDNDHHQHHSHLHSHLTPSSRRGPTPGPDAADDADDDDSVLYHDYSCPYQFSSAAPVTSVSGPKRRDSGNSKQVAHRPMNGGNGSTLQKKRQSGKAPVRTRGPEYFD